MRKILKKKVNVFGKKLPVFVIALMGMFLVSAALTGYIANTVQSDVTVSAPILQQISSKSISGEWDDDGYIIFTGIHGGESITTYGKSENLADVPITGKTNFIVTNLLGVTCADFESVWVTLNIDGTVLPSIELIDSGYCNSVTGNPNTVEFDYGSSTTWVAGQVDLTETVVTFKTDAVGTYTFSSAITPTA